MQYVAVLQRHDSAHVDVAVGNELAEVIADARAIYTALVPMILTEGRRQFDTEASGGRKSDADAGTMQHARDAREFGWLVSEHLRAQEWGIGVYERDRDGMQLVHHIGATREEPSS